MPAVVGHGPGASHVAALLALAMPPTGIQPTGQAVSSSYQFGIHSEAIYNAESVKTNIYKSIITPPPLVNSLGKFINVGPQYDLTLQSQVWESQVQGGLSPVVQHMFVPQQTFDPTLPAVITRSATPQQTIVISPVSPFIFVPQQAFDPTVQSQFYEPSVTFPGLLITWIGAGPDPTEYFQLRPNTFKSVVGTVPQPLLLKSYFVGEPQVDLTIQSQIRRSSPGIQGPTITMNVPVPPQAFDPTQQSVLTKPLKAPPIPGAFIRPIISAPQLADLTQQSRFYPAVPRPIVVGRTIVPNPFVAGQVDLTVNGTKVWTPSTFTTPPPPPTLTSPPGLYGDRVILPAKKLGETVFLAIDFISKLGAGETIVSAVCTCTVYTGNDPSPSAVISGASLISGTIVSQLVTGGVLGTIYEILAKATTSLGQTIELPGFLAVVPDLA